MQFVNPIALRKPVHYGLLATVFLISSVTLASLVFDESSLKQKEENVRNTMKIMGNTLGQTKASKDETGYLDELPRSSSRKQNYSLDEIVELKSPIDRTTKLLNLLLQSNEDQVIEMLERSTQLERPVNVRTQAFILQKLVRINPSIALAKAQQFNPPRLSYLLNSMFREWSQIDLVEAISGAATLRSELKLAALDGILRERRDLTNDKRREIARQLDNEQHAVNLINLEKISESVGDPVKIFEEVVESTKHDSKQFEVLEQIALVWVEKIGLEALDQIIAALDNVQTKSWISKTVLGTVAQSNPSEALEYALKLDNDPSNESKIAVVQEWAISDPQEALDAISSVQQYGMRRQLQRRLITTWADYHPRELLADINLLPSELFELATQTAVVQIAEGAPHEAAGIVSNLDDTISDFIKLDVAETVVHSWFRRDVDATIDWVLNDPGLENQRYRLLNYLLASLVEYDSNRAMEVALKHHVGENDTGLEAFVVLYLARHDLDEALEYMPLVRNASTKTDAFSMIGHELVKDHRTNEALKLIGKIPDYAKSEYRKHMFATWALFNPMGLYTFLDRTPSSQLTSEAALCLLVNDRQGQRLSPDQIESVKIHLSEDDARKLEQHKLKKPYVRQRQWAF